MRRGDEHLRPNLGHHVGRHGHRLDVLDHGGVRLFRRDARARRTTEPPMPWRRRVGHRATGTTKRCELDRCGRLLVGLRALASQALDKIPAVIMHRQFLVRVGRIQIVDISLAAVPRACRFFRAILGDIFPEFGIEDGILRLFVFEKLLRRHRLTENLLRPFGNVRLDHTITSMSAAVLGRHTDRAVIVAALDAADRSRYCDATSTIVRLGTREQEVHRGRLLRPLRRVHLRHLLGRCHQRCRDPVHGFRRRPSARPPGTTGAAPGIAPAGAASGAMRSVGTRLAPRLRRWTRSRRRQQHLQPQLPARAAAKRASSLPANARSASLRRLLSSRSPTASPR